MILEKAAEKILAKMGSSQFHPQGCSRLSGCNQSIRCCSRKTPLLNTSLRGSLSLGMIFSSAGGILFTLLFYNLAQYIGATQAIKEAARATARCITPTDPQCVKISRAGADTPSREWFAYRQSDRDRVAVDASIEVIHYSAQLTNLNWTAQYSTYETRLVPQPYQITSSIVPLAEFQEVLPNEIPAGSVSASYRIGARDPIYRPKFQPNFPVFTQDLDSNPADWRNARLPLQFQGTNWSSLSTIAGGETASFSVQGRVPDLNAAADSVCLDNGNPCNGARAAGATSGNNDWQRNAYIAIKAFSEIRALAPGLAKRSEVQWADAQDGAGLYLDINEGSGWTTRCLGGRSSFSNLSEEPKMYNLWIRGPRGANGGTSPVCSSGVNHDQIRIARGAQFRIRGYLKNQSSNPAQVRAQLNYYFDEYLPDHPQPIEVSCKPEHYSGARAKTNLLSCAPEQCLIEDCPSGPGSSCTLKSLLSTLRNRDLALGFSEEQIDQQRRPILTACTNSPNQALTSYTCENTPDSEPQSTLARLPATIAVPICDLLWTPGPACGSITGTFSDPTMTCCWNKVGSSSGQTIEVGAAPATCSSAKLRANKDTCDELVVINNQGDRQTCASAYSTLEEIAASAAQANDLLPSGAVRFSPTAKLQFLPQDPTQETTAFSWSLPRDSSGRNLNSGQFNVVANVLPPNLQLQSFKKITAPQDKPSSARFLPAILAHSSGGEASPGYEDFLTAINARVSVSLTSESPAPLAKAYPFSEPVPEIYFGQLDGSKGWDFNQDCRPDSSCNSLIAPDCLENHSCFSSEEQMLRYYAASEILQAADPSLVFSYDKQSVGHRHLEAHNLNELAALELPSCSPVKLICSSASDREAEVVSLGVAPLEPEECGNGTYDQCFSKIHGTEFQAASTTTNIDYSVAQQVGFAQIREIIPFASIGESCSDNSAPSCVAIEVDADSGDFAQVSVSYNMPITFPLDLILGKESIRLDFTKRELIERKAVGRTELLF